jgi:hypothetical protein
MMNARGRRLLSAAACAVALTLTGCGDDGPTEDNQESEFDGPIAEFMGWESTGASEQPEFTEAERQQHYQVQDLIVTCMSEAGFEYTPEPFYGDQEDAFEDPYADVWQLQQDDPEAFAREYGYGFTTLDYDSEVIETPDPSNDPNAAYRESLSPAAQEEYDKALWGDFEAIEEGSEEGEAGVAQPSGCSNDAYEQVFGTEGESGEDQFTELFEEWDALYQRIENDPRMDGATQAWLGCMSDAGYPDLEDLYGGQNEVSQRQSELYGYEDGGLLPAPIEEGEGEGEDDSGEASVPPSEPVEPDPAALEELRQFERDIAVADYTCRQEHDVDGVERDVRYEHEEQFIEDNREQLEAYRDWSNEQGTRG